MNILEGLSTFYKLLTIILLLFTKHSFAESYFISTYNLNTYNNDKSFYYLSNSEKLNNSAASDSLSANKITMYSTQILAGSVSGAVAGLAIADLIVNESNCDALGCIHAVAAGFGVMPIGAAIGVYGLGKIWGKPRSFKKTVIGAYVGLAAYFTLNILINSIYFAPVASALGAIAFSTMSSNIIIPESRNISTLKFRFSF